MLMANWLCCTDGTDYTDTQVTIGAQNASDSNVLNGYMSFVRIIKGTALYTSNSHHLEPRLQM